MRRRASFANRKDKEATEAIEATKAADEKEKEVINLRQDQFFYH